GVLHEFEANLIWRAAELLGVSARERVTLKKLVAARVGFDFSKARGLTDTESVGPRALNRRRPGSAILKGASRWSPRRKGAARLELPAGGLAPNCQKPEISC